MELEYWQTPSDSGQYRERLERYLEAILQRDVPLHEWDGRKRLPVFLTRLYRFFETRIGHTPLLFMAARQAGNYTPAEMRKHVDLVNPEFDGVVVYSAERLTASSRARLVATGVAFAVPGNQLYVPELATDLRERFRGPRPERPDKLSPSAQLVLFFHLLRNEREQPRTPTELAALLPYSTMTMGRAFDELAAAGLARIERQGRKKLLWFRAEGRLLVDTAKTFLIRPERRLDHIRWLQEPPELPLAGEHALARLSDLSPPATPPVFAVTSRQMRDFLAVGRAETNEAAHDSDVTLEIWRYDPSVLAQNDMVDPLSLFAQFWDDPDERLSIAVDRLLEQWA
ncbi:MAG: hypothetical protein OXJ37_22485 [Bryobacterales bacterium]|nr:hypothetical protein [Bryobacterales bacterium]